MVVGWMHALLHNSSKCNVSQEMSVMVWAQCRFDSMSYLPHCSDQAIVFSFRLKQFDMFDILSTNWMAHSISIALGGHCVLGKAASQYMELEKEEGGSYAKRREREGRQQKRETFGAGADLASLIEDSELPSKLVFISGSSNNMSTDLSRVHKKAS